MGGSFQAISVESRTPCLSAKTAAARCNRKEGFTTRLASERARAPFSALRTRGTLVLRRRPVLGGAPPLPLERASERAIVLPTKYKSSVRRSVATAAAALLTSVWWSRGRAFPRLSFKQMNHLFRCRFLEFLGGPGPAAAAGPRSYIKTSLSEGAGWNERDRGLELNAVGAAALLVAIGRRTDDDKKLRRCCRRRWP